VRRQPGPARVLRRAPAPARPPQRHRRHRRPPPRIPAAGNHPQRRAGHGRGDAAASRRSGADASGGPHLHHATSRGAGDGPLAPHLAARDRRHTRSSPGLITC